MREQGTEQSINQAMQEMHHMSKMQIPQTGTRSDTEQINTIYTTERTPHRTGNGGTSVTYATPKPESLISAGQSIMAPSPLMDTPQVEEDPE